MPYRPGYYILSLKEANAVYNNIKKHLPFKSYLVGSARREIPVIYDIDIIILPGNFDTNIMKILFYSLLNITRFGNKIISGKYYYYDRPIAVQFFISTIQELPYNMLQYTGPKSYNIRIRKYVKNQYGWLLNQYGLYYVNNSKKKVIGSTKIKTEKDLIKFIGTTYYEPPDRK